MRIRIIIALSLAAVMCCGAILRVRGDFAETEKCREFLAGYGWETGENTETVGVRIPAELDEVYKNYNILQNEAGLDLLPYRGMSGIRHTFIVNNYPVDAGETVYADVICIKGEPVAGDIMTVSIDGFMHSLIYPSF